MTSAAADATFERLRPRLHGIAYRMTGSVSDAEDLCQEAWLRWAAVDHDTVANPEAYLVVTTSRLALDRIRSAARQRETYVGPFLPEPIVGQPVLGGGTGGGEDPAAHAELSDSLTFAFLVLLDQLTPVERAVLLLHDVFSYPFEDVAAAVDRSPAAVRQIASRSRRKLREGPQPLPRPDDQQVLATLGGLLAAIASGDIPAVMGHLAPDVVDLSDGGATVRAGRRPVVGADRVARVLVNLSRRHPELAIRFTEVNARPGLLFTDGDVTIMVLTVDLDEHGRVARIFSQLNPDKLRHLAPFAPPTP